MDIVQAPSPNFDDRTLPIHILVLHYTGMESADAALAHMRDPAAKVAAHYMIEENGRIVQLVDEDKRAWHAGASYWRGETDINSASIGIEIVNGGHDFGLPEFPDVQIEQVIALARAIKKRHHISDFNIVAHSDIAPHRKQDPGEKFPWPQLADHDLGVWPDIKVKNSKILFAPERENADILTIPQAFRSYGYDMPLSGRTDLKTRSVIKAFQRRYRTSIIDGLIDSETLKKLTILLNYRKMMEGTKGVG